MASMGMTDDVRNNKLVFETMTHDMSYLNLGDPADPSTSLVSSTIFNLESPLICSSFKPLCGAVIWDTLYHCFYRIGGSMARRITAVLQYYPSLQHENGALMWLSFMPANAYVVCGTLVCFCVIKIRVH